MNSTALIECLKKLYLERVSEKESDERGDDTLDLTEARKYMESELKRPLTDLEERVLSLSFTKGELESALIFSQRYQIGQWMRFTEDYAIDKNQFFVSGMLAVVEPDPYSLCTPGVSVMVGVLGTKISYGFPCEILEPVAEPSPEQKEQSIQDAGRAWEIIKEKGSWVGFPFRDLDCCTVLKELQVHLRKLPEATDPEYFRGTMKRIRKVLHAFSPSPWGKEALELSKRCEPHIASQPPPKELLEDIKNWMLNVLDGRLL